MLAVIIAALSCLALVLKALPWFTQNNLAMILLFLPPHAAIAAGLFQAESREPRAESPVP